MENQKIDFNKVRSGKEIFSDYVTFMKTEWKPYCIALAVCVLPFALLGGYFLSKQNFDFLATADYESISLGNLYCALLFSFLSKFFGMFISCIYVLHYIDNKATDLDALRGSLTTNFIIAFCVVLFYMCALTIGFTLFIIPGLLLLPPLSILLYDVLFMKQTIFVSLSRCIQLCKTNASQSFGVVYIAYIVVFLLSYVIGAIIPSDNSALNIIVSAALTVVTETVMIPFILLYYSLANQNIQLKI